MIASLVFNTNAYGIIDLFETNACFVRSANIPDYLASLVIVAHHVATQNATSSPHVATSRRTRATRFAFSSQRYNDPALALRPQLPIYTLTSPSTHRTSALISALMRRAQSTRHHGRPSVAQGIGGMDDMGVLKETDESVEDSLRRQLLEKDRENDKVRVRTLFSDRSSTDYIVL